MFAPAGIAGLLTAFEGGEPFVVHGDPARFPPWLRESPLRSVEDVCAAYRGRILHGRREGGARFHLLERGAPAELLAGGEALYLPDIADVVPAASSWLRELELSLGIPSGCARATAWVAPAGEGTALHFDAEDVISIQLSGSKRFEVGEPVALGNAASYQFGPGIPAAADLYPQCAAGFPDAAAARFTTLAMQPGSVLALPRGHWHRTHCETPSLSISVVLSPPLLMDWALGVLRHWALEAPRWRAPLYGAPQDAEKVAMAQALCAWASDLARVPGDAVWHPQTTLQWCPSRAIDWEPPLHLVDCYDASRTPLPAGVPGEATLRRLAARREAFTLAEAREQWGEGIEAGLAALVAIGALYCWSVPRRGVG